MATARNADLDAAIALTRFGLGARPGELRTVGADARAYLSAQIRPVGADRPPNPPDGKLMTAQEMFGQDAQNRRIKHSGGLDNRRRAKQNAHDAFEDEFLARTMLAAQTRAGFRERWALFWCNHFAVRRKMQHSQATVGLFERDAIRPNVFGRFEAMLLASSRHPAMLLYLDQTKSAGPNSRAVQGGNARITGLNENLAREIMELHSLGVASGYTQTDVTEFAKALTGWTVGDRGRSGQFAFAPDMHEPGDRHIFGKTYREAGENQALAALKDFAASHHTASHLATKLARHFVSDQPPQALIDRLTAAYRESEGNLGHVAQALIAAPEAWDPAMKKLRTPYEFVIAAYRAAGAAPRRFSEVAHPMKALGQNPFTPPSPKGFDDEAESWAGAAAIMGRISWAADFAQRFAPQDDPVARARDVLGARLTQAAATAIGRAETRNEAFALLLMTPEFQRR